LLPLPIGSLFNENKSHGTHETKQARRDSKHQDNCPLGNLVLLFFVMYGHF
jgi:hypothetical protein